MGERTRRTHATWRKSGLYRTTSCTRQLRNRTQQNILEREILLRRPKRDQWKWFFFGETSPALLMEKSIDNETEKDGNSGEWLCCKISLLFSTKQRKHELFSDYGVFSPFLLLFVGLVILLLRRISTCGASLWWDPLEFLLLLWAHRCWCFGTSAPELIVNIFAAMNGKYWYCYWKHSRKQYFQYFSYS